ncbi:hypothetical protein V493_03440, partial [Pseudogymnoascus sp. VKM F-4281 (FW-2241)]
MDMSGSSSNGRVPRGEAAQRASENTAKAARNMLQDSYRVKRRRVEGVVVEPRQEALVQQAYVVPSSPPAEPVHRTQPMSAEETKYEQARLLTLLRSISPLAVVDQMCKALAFFGGIPGAPAPEDEAFPASEDANGSGALFVGWLSEIFPELERKVWRSSGLGGGSRGKRPRGRPKGSKASKVRKDKGIKKGPKDGGRDESRGSGVSIRAVSVMDEDDDADGADDEWVDIGESESILHDKGSGQTGANASGAFIPINSTGSGTIELEPEELNDPEPIDPPATANIGKRRPGRPRGSRNRPKEKDAEGNEVPAVEVFSLNQASVTSTSSPVMNMQSATPTSQPKRKAGRPPGSKTKPKETPILPTSVSPVLSRSNHAPASQTATPSSNIASVPQGLSAEERAVLEAYRKSRSGEPAVPTPIANPAEKRKRGPRKSSNGPTAENAVAVPTVAILPPSTSAPVVAPQPSEPSRTNSQQATPKSASAAPTAKRQRKSKDLTIAAPKTNMAQDPAILKSTSTPTPASAPVARSVPVTSSQRPVSVPSTTVFSSLPMTSEQIMAPVRAPAQGLQAHYDRFTSIQQKQQQQQQQHQQHQQQQQQQQQQQPQLDPRHDQQILSRTSPLQTQSFYQPHSQPQPRHIPTSSSYTHYQPQQSPRTYHPGANQTMDPYRAAGAGASHPQQQQQQHATFSPRQQQNPQQQQQFAHYAEASFIDLPALEEPGADGGG